MEPRITVNAIDYFSAITMFDTALEFLKAAKENMTASVTRCQNCGKVMDQSVCPYCGYVQH